MPGKITVKQVSDVVGKKVKKTEFKDLVDALPEGNDFEEIGPLFDLMVGDELNDYRDGAGLWDAVKLSLKLDRLIPIIEINTAEAMIWMQAK